MADKNQEPRRVGSHRRAPGGPPPVEQPASTTPPGGTPPASIVAPPATPAVTKEPATETRETRSRVAVHNPPPMVGGQTAATSGPPRPVRFAPGVEDPLDEELKQWEAERKAVVTQHNQLRKELAANPDAVRVKRGTILEKALSAADKRRTIGVATPHSHFFAELEQARKAAQELKLKEAAEKEGKGGAAGAAGAAQPTKSDAPIPKMGTRGPVGGATPAPAAAATAAVTAAPSTPSAPVDKAAIQSPDGYDPGSDPSRPAPQVPFPGVRKLTIADVFTKDQKKVQLNVLRDHLLREGRLALETCKELLKRGSELLKAEPNALELTAPCLVFGDIHGQFYDMINMLDKAGPVERYKYLFLGDYVDRGTFGCETVFYLMGLKINHPDRVFMLRGNHESRLLAEHFNFRAEVLYKYNEDVYNQIQETFDCLPLAATLAGAIGKFFCVHGGLSPDVNSLKEINEIDRFHEPPEKGPFCDLLWSDPIEESGAIGLTALQLARWHAKTFEPNPTRGCSYFYGYGAVKDFLAKNNYSCVVRAHEVQKQGYKLHKFKKFDLKQPPVVTVFSAPNYCDMYENWAAWLIFEDTSYTFGQVAWVDHPYYLPNFSNALAFTFPFVVENFMKILADVLTAIGEIGYEHEAPIDPQDELAISEDIVQKRVRAMGRIALMMKKVRVEREHELRTPSLKPGSDKYDLALSLDMKNEKRPLDARKRFKTM